MTHTLSPNNGGMGRGIVGDAPRVIPFSQAGVNAGGSEKEPDVAKRTTNPTKVGRSALQDDELDLRPVVEERPPCACGCGGSPAGKKSRYLPGHDARHLSAQKRAAVEAAPAAPVAVNAQDRPRRAVRPPKAKESTARAAGSEA
jgi:hypothetical protein